MAAVAALAMLVVSIITAVVSIHRRTINTVIAMSHVLALGLVVSGAMGSRWGRGGMLARYCWLTQHCLMTGHSKTRVDNQAYHQHQK
ncbi:hypothetical protein DFP78_102774 [Photobacterium lutimaris]|nr:hypothetical protein DFP78_102774 [Photobacterium lutimaris]